jgi:hypothetical protein
MFASLQRARDAVLDWERRGWFSGSLLVGDAALALWLLFAQRAFLGLPAPTSHTLGKFTLGTALLAVVVRLHAFSGRRFRWLLLKAALLAPGIGLLASSLHAAPAAAVWLSVATATSLVAFRAAYFAARAAWPKQPLEAVRWIALGSVASAVMWPFYRAGSLGAGDAHWYAIMLGDFVTQLRAGIFPVWAGQSEYAFNGAVSPLRLAPWFQHAGGLVDLLSARALNFVAIKNATLVLSALATAGSAYVCLRLILPRRPGIACLLAALFVASPGVLAPLVSGDQYMTFVAMPFLPVALYGCWRVWTTDNFQARLAIAVGLGGLWLSHTPVALWTTFLALAACTAKGVARREWSADVRRALLTSALFVALGTFPIFSVFAIDNQNRATAVGAVAAEEIARCFPANFLPINTSPGADPLFTYQTGYAALGAFALALLLFASVRPRGAAYFILATMSVALFVLPIPGVSAAIWTPAPGWFMAVNNVWPMQRLFGVWSALMLFSLAAVVSAEQLSRRTWLTSLLLIMLCGGGVWSAREAQKLTVHAQATTSDVASTVLALKPSNIGLSRYAWASFATTPGYVSHGYMDPLLENRLLDGTTLTLLTANADRAAPLVRINPSPEVLPRLVASGLFTAVQSSPDNYLLEPGITLAPGKHHALRFEFFRPDTTKGILQSFDGSMSRQYLLPDSGENIVHAGPPRAFGSLATNSHVMPLETAVDTPIVAHFRFLGSGAKDSHSFATPRFAFARYWLYTYEPADLAVKVDSLLPYRVRTDVARAAWLETPRMWLTGYRATVNGAAAEVRRSPDNLVMISLPPGPSTIALDYFAPWWLRGAFWICLTSWAIVIATGIRRVRLTARAWPA